MRFAKPLVPATLIRRYKRFLADMRLEDGREVVAHCPNPGAMTGLAEPGMRVWLEPNDDPKKKLGFRWRLVELPGAWAGIDTSVPNRVVAEALAAGQIPGFADHEIRAEMRYGANSRVDFLATDAQGARVFIEVKNVHLMREPGLAEFPDSVTKRGAKHLDEMAREVAAGSRAVMLYVIQRDDCDRLALARDIDPGYAAAFDRARAAGVEAIAWACRIGREEITLDRPIVIEE